MKSKAVNALIKMGVPASNKGFKYIVDAMVLFEDEEIRYGKTGFLYHKIAKLNNTTYSKVERAIRHAFTEVLAKGNLEEVKKYLTFEKTTNSNLLAVLYIRLSQEE